MKWRKKRMHLLDVISSKYGELRMHHERSLRKSLFWTLKSMAGKIGFSGARKSMLLKASSGELCAPHNFVHLVTLRGTCVRLIVYLVVHQMKYVTERWSNVKIFCNFLMQRLKGYLRKGNPDFASHGKLYITWLWS